MGTFLALASISRVSFTNHGTYENHGTRHHKDCSCFRTASREHRRLSVSSCPSPKLLGLHSPEMLYLVHEEYSGCRKAAALPPVHDVLR